MRQHKLVRTAVAAVVLIVGLLTPIGPAQAQPDQPAESGAAPSALPSFGDFPIGYQSGHIGFAHARHNGR